MLKINDIHTCYGAIEALKGISIDVDQGEIITLIGANTAPDRPPRSCPSAVCSLPEAAVSFLKVRI